MKLPGIKTAITPGERTYAPSLTIIARECGLDYYTIIWPLYPALYGDFQNVFSFILGAIENESEEIPILTDIKLQPSSRDYH